MIRLKDIKEAAKKLEGVIVKTPLIHSYSLSELSGANVFLKLENLQRTGSFKIRGAYNKLYKLRGKVEKVIAASAGNHAQGVALAANLLGMKAILVMPEGTPINKFLAVKHYGAEIILHGKNFDDAYSYARKLEKQKRIPFIHPFDDPDIISGQGTVGLEIADSIKDFDSIIVPVGGGGLISGVSIALKGVNPKVKIIGVQASNSPSMFLSMKKKSIVETESARSIADDIMIKKIGEIPFEIAKKYVEDVFTVDDDEIEDALLLLTQRKRIVVEGAGAVGLAGLLKRKRDFKIKNTVILVSGGNIDINFLAKIIERGLVKNGSLLRLELELPDIPGALGKLTTLFGKVKGNIIQIFHDRYSKKLPIDKTIVEISLETRNFDHQHEILKLLRESGYKPRLGE